MLNYNHNGIPEDEQPKMDKKISWAAFMLFFAAVVIISAILTILYIKIKST